MCSLWLYINIGLGTSKYTSLRRHTFLTSPEITNSQHHGYPSQRQLG